MTENADVPAIQLQDRPRIYLTTISGKWLLEHTTPSWRIKDPIQGFQRMVSEERARQIATAVLDQQRTFPNAIVLATNVKEFPVARGVLSIPKDTLFLVVDGQHRLWAQHFSQFNATYACLIHMNLSEVEMAKLFLEINDNQRRVPSSLRWDLVRLVQPEDDPFAIAAAEIVYQLATDKESPLFQRVDLTGENAAIALKQGSLAPEIKTLVSSRHSGLREVEYDAQYTALLRFLAAIKSLNTDEWNSGDSPFYKARVLRAMVRLIPEIATKVGRAPGEVTADQFARFVRRVKRSTLADEEIRAAQGSAGIKAIYETIHGQVFGSD